MRYNPLAAGGTAAELEQAFDEALFQRVVRGPQLDDILDRARGRPGVASLRALVLAERSESRTRSQPEKSFRALIAAAKLPPPEPSVRLGRFVVDFLWRPEKVVVEVDAFGTHGRRRSFEGDRARDGDLQAFGLRVLRVTWRQIDREPYAVVARVAALLAVSGGDRHGL